MIDVSTFLAGDAPWCLIQAEALRFLDELPDACVDGVLTDPPYSSGGMTRGDRTQKTSAKYVLGSVKNENRHADFTGDNRDQKSFAYWTALWVCELQRVCKPGAPVMLFTDWRQLSATIDAFQAGGLVFRGVVPWDKTEGVRPQKSRFMAQCEFVVWGSNGPMPDREAIPCLNGIFRCYPDPREKLHIAGKPVELLREYVKIVDAGGVVLDPFAGSASAGVAALLEGRRYLGAELLPAEHAKALERLEAHDVGLSVQDARKGQTSLWAQLKGETK